MRLRQRTGAAKVETSATIAEPRCFIVVRSNPIPSPRPRRGLLLVAGLILSGLTLLAFAADPVPASDNDASPSTEDAAVDIDNEVPEVPPKRDATSPNNPYRAIVARNAFRLKEPAPPPPPPTNLPAAPEPVKIDVKLAGLARIKGVRYAYLMVPDSQRPGQFVYPSLTDDPEHGRVRHGSGLEVREIDMKKQTVRVVNGGVEVTLNFKDNGIKQGAVPGTAPAKPGPGGIPAPNANINRAANATTTVFPAGGGGPVPTPDPKANTGSEPVIFSRNANRASVPSGNPFTPTVSNAGGNLGGVATGAGGTALPSRIQRLDPATPNIPSVPVEHQYDILIKQRQAANSLGVPLPPIPGLPAAEVAVPQQ